MCGICGILHFDGAPVDPAALARMMDQIAHRGPDDRGAVTDGPVGLAMTRLAIVDLDGGHQPMTNETGSVQLVFNGEGYNHLVLHRELEQQGHTFRTRSDSEAVAHAFEQYGVNCVDRIEGMFGFAAWSTEARRLLLARDRLGEKPLYYAVTPRSLVFASELKAILASGEPIDDTIDPAALSQYLSFMMVPAPRSILRGIQKLEPGHTLACDAGGRIEVRRYWSPSPRPLAGITEAGALEEFGRLFRSSVEARLMSDVPLGAFLSGGLDSSLVVAQMAELMGGQPVQTFNIEFEGGGDTMEGEHALRVARHLGAQHHPLLVRPDAFHDFDRWVYHFDEPFAVSSAIGLYYLARHARDHVKVVLTGDGADELFAGYKRYYWDKLLSNNAAFAASGRLVRKLVPPERAHAWFSQAGNRWDKLLAYLLLEPDEAYAFMLSRFSGPEQRQLVSPAWRDGNGGASAFMAAAYRKLPALGHLQRRLQGDVAVSLPDEMLAKVDKMTMAHGLEARPPFLDRTLVDFAAGLPDHLLMRGTVQKYLLKRFAESRLPHDLVHRSKQGFHVPLDGWFRGALREPAHDILLSQASRERGVFDPAAVAALLKAHEAGQGNWGLHIFIMLVFERWCQLLLDGRHLVAAARSA